MAANEEQRENGTEYSFILISHHDVHILKRISQDQKLY